MGIVNIPLELEPREPLNCAICSVRLTLNGATAGQHNGRGCQMFACVSHLMEVQLLILGWADFAIRDRDLTLSTDNESRFPRHKEGGPDVWINT